MTSSNEHLLDAVGYAPGVELLLETPAALVEQGRSAREGPIIGVRRSTRHPDLLSTALQRQ
jgi:hypothetical protein